MSGATFDWTFPQAFTAGSPPVGSVGHAVTRTEGAARADTAASGRAAASTATEGEATAENYDT